MFQIALNPLLVSKRVNELWLYEYILVTQAFGPRNLLDMPKNFRKPNHIQYTSF